MFDRGEHGGVQRHVEMFRAQRSAQFVVEDVLHHQRADDRLFGGDVMRRHAGGHDGMQLADGFLISHWSRVPDIRPCVLQAAAFVGSSVPAACGKFSINPQTNSIEISEPCGHLSGLSACQWLAHFTFSALELFVGLPSSGSPFLKAVFV
jgi:hypothetical protein